MILGIINIIIHIAVFIYSITTLVVLIYNRKRLTLGMLGIMLIISLAILIITARLMITESSFFDINFLMLEQNLFFLLTLYFINRVVRVAMRITYVLNKFREKKEFTKFTKLTRKEFDKIIRENVKKRKK